MIEISRIDFLKARSLANSDSGQPADKALGHISVALFSIIKCAWCNEAINFGKTHLHFYAFVRFKLGKYGIEMEENLKAKCPDYCPSLKTFNKWLECFPDPDCGLEESSST